MRPARAAERSGIDQQLAAVLFDFGGTLDGALPWKERMFRFLRAEGVEVTPERFDPLFYRADDALVGAIPDTLSLAETVGRLAAGLGAALGLSDDLVEHVARRFVDDTTRCVGDNLSLLSELSRRYELGIVSNFYGNLSRVCEDLGLRPLFGVIVDSTEVGCTKPDPRIFIHALAQLGLQPGAATFVGDSLPRDMAGARGVGMPHIWLTGESASPPRPCCADDHVIGSLAELRGLLL
jgi:HAD superfamily hydrolase (TIGR01549 family)